VSRNFDGRASNAITLCGSGAERFRGMDGELGGHRDAREEHTDSLWRRLERRRVLQRELTCRSHRLESEVHQCSTGRPSSFAGVLYRVVRQDATAPRRFPIAGAHEHGYVMYRAVEFDRKRHQQTARHARGSHGAGGTMSRVPRVARSMSGSVISTARHPAKPRNSALRIDSASGDSASFIDRIVSRSRHSVQRE